MNNRNHQFGLTLIEVMVAAVILFSSIAAITLIYRGAILSSNKANLHITIAGAMPVILANIKQNISTATAEQSTFNDVKGQVWEVTYEWSAILLDKKSAPMKLDTDTGNYVLPPKRFNLWKVDLLVSYGQVQHSHSFNEFSWDNVTE